ncbi:unnamed protein product [Schistocephalus solidus]|uniref:Uncharacterized protein n=1 Tax=Schistocephalus solidus TaxID=70667 RepID=A0A183S7S9_SCHSO|nr:unnamed protein product [Schistocephalus solidus]
MKAHEGVEKWLGVLLFGGTKSNQFIEILRRSENIPLQESAGSGISGCIFRVLHLVDYASFEVAGNLPFLPALLVAMWKTDGFALLVGSSTLVGTKHAT